MALSSHCLADDPDSIRSALEDEKTTVTAALQAARESVLASLDRLIESAAQKGDLDRLESLKRERADLNDRSILPMSVRSTEITRVVSGSMTRQERLYGDLIKAHTQEGNIDAARIAQRQLDALRSSFQFIDLEQEFRRELLQNPSCEEASSAGSYTSWQVVSGDWNPGTRDSVVASTKPADGSRYFFPGNCGIGEISQDVDLSLFARLIDESELSCLASVYVQSLRQSPPDSCEFAVEFKDKDGKVLQAHLSGKIASTNRWKQIGGKQPIPQKTRTISFRLIAHRTGPRGSTVNNAYFDQASLKVGLAKKSRTRR